MSSLPSPTAPPPICPHCPCPDEPCRWCAEQTTRVCACSTALTRVSVAVLCTGTHSLLFLGLCLLYLCHSLQCVHECVCTCAWEADIPSSPSTLSTALRSMTCRCLGGFVEMRCPPRSRVAKVPAGLSEPEDNSTGPSWGHQECSAKPPSCAQEACFNGQCS